MSRHRRRTAALLLGIALLLPLPGCVGPRGGGGLGPLMQIALGIGVSVGTYYLVRQLD